MVYDYIFCGFGLSTIVLLAELESQDLLNGKKILLLEQEQVFREQSFCFWEQRPGRWDQLLSGKWNVAYFTNGNQKIEVLDGLTYKCISAASLRQYILKKLERQSCDFKNEKVVNWVDEGNFVSVYTKNQTYATQLFFNSAYDPKELIGSKTLLQHFEGWYIKCKGSPFNAAEATIMDFSVPQKDNTRFMYVLPFSKNTALIEYTLFSPSLIPADEYAQAINNYLQTLGITDFEIEKKETGIIPMTAHRFWKKNTQRVLHIGTAGGWTKASTGYSFSNSVKFSQKVAQMLTDGKIDFSQFYRETRFNWYDKIFIEVLYEHNSIGKTLFYGLFNKSGGNRMLQFMAEDTRPGDELSIIAASPKLPFISALWRVLLK